MTDWRTVAEKVPLQAVNLMAQQLTEFGHDVRFTLLEPSGLTGTVDGLSGIIHFRWNDERFEVRIEKNEGHFPERMIVGGMRQFVEEAVERVNAAMKEQMENQRLGLGMMTGTRPKNPKNS